MSSRIHIIHGWTYTLDAWSDCVAELEANDCDVVQLRVPGLTEPSNDIWTVPKYVEWLHEQVENEKDLVILAHSNGGRIAMAYDEAHPNRIKKLILLDSAGIPHESKGLTLQKKLAHKAMKIVKPVLTDSLRRTFSKVAGSSDYANAPENMKQTMKNLFEHDASFDPASVTAPTAIIWGAKDTVTPLSDAHILDASIPHSSGVSLIEEAAHSPHKTHPKEVVQAVIKATS